MRFKMRDRQSPPQVPHTMLPYEQHLAGAWRCRAFTSTFFSSVAVISAPQRWKRLSISAIAYAATATLATALFVLLHHIGNQTPAPVVAQKAADVFEAWPFEWGSQHPNLGRWEYCHLTGAVVAGSAPSTRAFHDALLPRRLLPDPAYQHLRSGGMCQALLEAVTHSDPAKYISELPHVHMATWRWHGSKALYAIGLRFLTIAQYYELIRWATYSAYLALVAALMLVGWRAVVVAGPVVVFGMAGSGIEELTEVAKGTPYIWALLTPALFALLLRFRPDPGIAPRVFCFFAGLVASYLWLFDGGNFVAAALIGLVAWLHWVALPVKARAARAAGCVFAHTVGFLLGIVLCSTIRSSSVLDFDCDAAIYGDCRTIQESFEWFYRAAEKIISRVWGPLEHDLQGKNIGAWAELLPLSVSGVQVLVVSAAVALGAALIIAGYHAWRRRWGPFQEVLWIGALGIGLLVHFALPNDAPWHAARFMHLPLALCWSALAAALLRTTRPGTVALVSIGAGGVLLAAWLAWQHLTTTALLQADVRPLIRGYFNVDYIEDQHRLIYHRDGCDAVDAKRQFWLEVYPENLAALPTERRDAGHVTTTFYFINHHLFTFGGGCTAVVDLPAFPVARIATQRNCCYQGEPTWAGTANFDASTTSEETDAQLD